MDAAGKNAERRVFAEELAPVRAMITAGGTALGGDTMDLMPKLGAIVCYGTGYDGVDLKAAAGAISQSAQSRRQRIFCCRHRDDPDACQCRRLIVADGYVRDGSWAASKPSPMMRPQNGMRGRKVGVYGMGEIGRKIAARVAAFESEVGYFSRSRHDVPYRHFDSLAALADWCSVLMVAVRAGPDTITPSTPTFSSVSARTAMSSTSRAAR